MGRLTGARLSPLVAVLPLLFGTVQPNALRLQRLGDGSNCTRRLVADGCLQSLSKRACGDCAEKHGADLLQANCTKDLVTDWCEHKLPVPPRPPPPAPGPAPPPPPWGNATRVLPLGDSITFGCGDQCDSAKDCMAHGHKKPAPCSPCSAGYRGPLWQALAAGTAGDPRGWSFVGTQSNGAIAAPRHEGHPGWTIPQIEAILGKWAAEKPDVILLHLGTNDLGGYVHPVATPEGAADRMRSLLNSTFAALPHTHVILASIIGATAKYGGHLHAAYNALLPPLVAEFTGNGASIDFLDMAEAAGLGAGCDGRASGSGSGALCCPFRIHPNDQGYRAMARVWAKSLGRHAINNAASTRAVDPRVGRVH